MLVNGCTGGFGLMALQFARMAGASVAGVCSTDALGVAADYGADPVIDFLTHHVTDLPARYDVILELSGKLPFDQASQILTDQGTYIDVAPSPASIVGNTIANPLRHHKHKLLLSKAHTDDLARIASLVDSDALRPPPLQIFAFEEFAAAYRAAESGSVIGKIVIQVSADS